MHKEMKRVLKEEEQRMKNYMDDIDETSELREMCKYCELYCGEKHDYSECKNKQCFKFWLAYEYLSLILTYN